MPFTDAERGSHSGPSDEVPLARVLFPEQEALQVVIEIDSPQKALKKTEAAPDLHKTEAAPDLQKTEAAPDLQKTEAAAPDLKKTEAAPDLKKTEAAPDLKKTEAAPDLKKTEADLEKTKGALENEERPVARPLALLKKLAESAAQRKADIATASKGCVVSDAKAVTMIPMPRLPTPIDEAHVLPDELLEEQPHGYITRREQLQLQPKPKAKAKGKSKAKAKAKGGAGDDVDMPVPEEPAKDGTEAVMEQNGGAKDKKDKGNGRGRGGRGKNGRGKVASSKDAKGEGEGPGQDGNDDQPGDELQAKRGRKRSNKRALPAERADAAHVQEGVADDAEGPAPVDNRRGPKRRVVELQAEAALHWQGMAIRDLEPSQIMDILHADDLKMRICLDFMDALDRPPPTKKYPQGLPVYKFWQLSVYWTRNTVGLLKKSESGSPNQYVGTLTHGGSGCLSLVLESVSHFAPGCC